MQTITLNDCKNKMLEALIQQNNEAELDQLVSTYQVLSKGGVITPESGTHSIEATHSFSPIQQTIILNAVRGMLNGHQSALLLNSHLMATYLEYISMQMDNVGGDCVLELSPLKFSQTSDAFQTANDLFTEIDNALFHAV